MPYPLPDAPLILVVDDDRDIAALVSHLLRRVGYRTAAASDGREALRAIGEERPELVLLDVAMPNLDGTAVARILQSAGNDAPAIIFLTAGTSVGERIDGLELDAVDCITKPFDATDMLARVEAALRVRRGRLAPAEG